MFIFGFVATLLLSSARAENLDQKLGMYINEFRLQPLERVTIKNEALFELGRKLFFDKNLSGNKNINCAECHHPRVMTHDGLPLALGEGARGIQAHGGRAQGTGKILARNSPALLNLTHDLPFMFWDGRVSMTASGVLTTPVPLRNDIAKTIKNTIAAQALFPMVDHAEMRGEKGSNPIANAASEHEAWDLITERLMSIKEYKEGLESIYPGEKINIGHIAEAIAEFETKNFTFTDTAYDRYLKGDLKALTEIQKIGMDVFFGKGKCGSCHQGEYLAAPEFHNIGIPQIGPGKKEGDDTGRYLVTGNRADLYAFRTPALRNVALTAPYMHNGAFKTLAQVIEHYDDIESSLTSYTLVNNWKNYVDEILGHNHTQDTLRLKSLSPKLSPNLNFQEEEEKALVEFLKGGLTDKKFLAQEIEEDYLTYVRFQLKETGFNKLLAATQSESTASNETYYYFDLMVQGGFALRELEQPVRLMMIVNDQRSTLVYRKQLHKEALAQSGIVLDGRFNKTESILVQKEESSDITNAFHDMFERIYSYITPDRQDEIPSTELSVIKSDVETIDSIFRKLPLKNMVEISDLMNIPVSKLFFVPTSSNEKKTYIRELSVNGAKIAVNLQSSFIRTENGAMEQTWAIEFETTKILKKDYDGFSQAIFHYLTEAKLATSDIGGQSPSPSKTTEKVLGLIYP